VEPAAAAVELTAMQVSPVPLADVVTPEVTAVHQPAAVLASGDASSRSLLNLALASPDCSMRRVNALAATAQQHADSLLEAAKTTPKAASTSSSSSFNINVVPPATKVTAASTSASVVLSESKGTVVSSSASPPPPPATVLCDFLPDSLSVQLHDSRKSPREKLKAQRKKRLLSKQQQQQQKQQQQQQHASISGNGGGGGKMHKK
jgi:hypothetical protein